MAISFQYIGQVCITCFNSGVHVDQPCKISTNCSIAACVDGNPIDGVVVAQSNNLATVAVKGFVTLAYTGSTPTLGFCPLAAAGNGKVKKLEGAHEYLVCNVDTIKKFVTFCL